VGNVFTEGELKAASQAVWYLFSREVDATVFETVMGVVSATELETTADADTVCPFVPSVVWTTEEVTALVCVFVSTTVDDTMTVASPAQSEGVTNFPTPLKLQASAP